MAPTRTIPGTTASRAQPRTAPILAARARDMRNLLALNVFARGVPMLAMGSEIGHSQQGNNNAYAQRQ